jgi:hypothetical protein
MHREFFGQTAEGGEEKKNVAVHVKINEGISYFYSHHASVSQQEQVYIALHKVLNQKPWNIMINKMTTVSHCWNRLPYTLILWE